ncbi:hypothetical protein [Amycolatopsis australiensis]|uniref:GLTT repeat-containing protein n=1 Tax=Amycolatopsis australiensis TaxID=546364 RepID=A0A1K1QKE5_9PSEU|nr:hypothetical protein [Amycolatopsis australiensis]SFW60099.1 hypothetical protein SAMN04489730_1893 [Amycolatopsis australiensis]
MRIRTKRTLQIALVSGGLLMVGAGSASAAEPATDPGLPGLTDTTGDLAQVLDTVLPATTQQPTAVLHTVPVHLLQQEPAPSAEVDGDLPEQDLNAPLGSELAATDLPALPAIVPLTATPDTVPDRATITPVDGELPEVPLHGTVSTQPLDPSAGTRVTGLHTSDVPAAADQRADMPALPLVGGLLPSTGLLPALSGVPDLSRLTSLGGLTQLAGSTPLTHGGRYNTGALTAPLSQPRN